MTYEIFDFKQKWDTIRPLLRRKKIINALVKRFNNYLSQYPNVMKYRGKFTSASAPWKYTKSDYWSCTIEKQIKEHFPNWEIKWLESTGIPNFEYIYYPEEFISELKQLGITIDDVKILSIEFQQISNTLSCIFEPKIGTLDYYCAYGLCHWLTNWLKEIGKILYPQHKWKIISDKLHSNVIGVLDKHFIIMDILNFKDTKYVLDHIIKNAPYFIIEGI